MASNMISAKSVLSRPNLTNPYTGRVLSVQRQGDGTLDNTYWDKREKSRRSSRVLNDIVEDPYKDRRDAANFANAYHPLLKMAQYMPRKSIEEQEKDSQFKALSNHGEATFGINTYTPSVGGLHSNMPQSEAEFARMMRTRRTTGKMPLFAIQEQAMQENRQPLSLQQEGEFTVHMTPSRVYREKQGRKLNLPALRAPKFNEAKEIDRAMAEYARANAPPEAFAPLNMNKHLFERQRTQNDSNSFRYDEYMRMMTLDSPDQIRVRTVNQPNTDFNIPWHNQEGPRDEIASAKNIRRKPVPLRQNGGNALASRLARPSLEMEQRHPGAQRAEPEQKDRALNGATNNNQVDFQFESVTHGAQRIQPEDTPKLTQRGPGTTDVSNSERVARGKVRDNIEQRDRDSQSGPGTTDVSNSQRVSRGQLRENVEQRDRETQPGLDKLDAGFENRNVGQIRESVEQRDRSFYQQLGITDAVDARKEFSSRLYDGQVQARDRETGRKNSNLDANYAHKAQSTRNNYMLDDKRQTQDNKNSKPQSDANYAHRSASRLYDGQAEQVDRRTQGRPTDKMGESTVDARAPVSKARQYGNDNQHDRETSRGTKYAPDTVDARKDIDYELRERREHWDRETQRGPNTLEGNAEAPVSDQSWKATVNEPRTTSRGNKIVDVDYALQKGHLQEKIEAEQREPRPHQEPNLDLDYGQKGPGYLQTTVTQAKAPKFGHFKPEKSAENAELAEETQPLLNRDNTHLARQDRPAKKQVNEELPVMENEENSRRYDVDRISVSSLPTTPRFLTPRLDTTYTENQLTKRWF